MKKQNNLPPVEFCEPFEKKTAVRGIILGTIFAAMFCLVPMFGGCLRNLPYGEVVLENLTFIIYGILFVIAAILFGGMLWKSVRKFDVSKLELLLGIGVLTIVGIVISAIVINAAGIVNANEEAVSSGINQYFVLDIFNAILFAPIVEELVFRFMLFRSASKCNTILAHIVTALAFGFFHIWDAVIIYGDFTQLISMLIYVVMSLGFSILYSKSKNICYPIALHMIINAIATFN